jgi:hypothetical protein
MGSTLSMRSDDHLPTHLFTYAHDGARWTLAIQAKDADDARARVGKLSYAQYKGELVAQIPVELGPLAKAAVWLRNTAKAIIRST